MKFKLHFILILFMLSCSEKAKKTSKKPTDLYISGHESITFESKINSKKYKLIINLPDSYKKNPEKEFPVLYILDGYWKFPLATSIYYNLLYDEMISECIIVGISYQGSNTNYDKLRMEDLTPSKIDEIPYSGGGLFFKDVLSNEIINVIDNSYNTLKSKRTLVGSSLGGLYAHFILFSQPELFSSYLIINPYYPWDDRYAFKLENMFSEKNKNLNVSVIIINGEKDSGIETSKKMISQIRSHEYKELNFKDIIVSDMGHSGTEPEGIARGLIFLND